MTATTTAVPRLLGREHVSARHPGDAVRLVVGVALLLVSLLAVDRGQLTVFERDLFRLANDLPGVLNPVLVVVMQGGNFVAPFAVALAALAIRARRLAFDVAVAGPLAWFAAKGVKRLVERPRPGGFLEEVTHYGSSAGMGFVSGHTAVATAIATVAAPYLPRRARRAVWAAAWAVGLSRIYVGAHLPLDVVGGAAVGWMIGAGIHLALGAPHRVPGLAEARRALARAGRHVDAVHRVGGQPRGSFPFIAEGPDGPVFVKLLDPEPRDRDWVFRVARFLAVRDVRDEATMPDTRAQGEHEAAMTLLAGQGGCRVPTIRSILQIGRGTWVVEDVVGRHSLDDMPPERVTDDQLVRTWQQVACLQRAGIAHRDLVVGNVVLDEAGLPSIVDFAHALSSPRQRELDNDVAELLASTALVVDVARAVDVARLGLGEEALGRALPELQPLALTAGTRRRLHRNPALLPALRAATAAACGVTLPAADSLVQTLPRDARSRRRRTLAAALGAAAVVVAVAGPDALREAALDGAARWYGVALLAAVVMWVQRGAALVAAANHRIALGRATLAATVAAAAPAVLGRSPDDVTAHFLERIGLRAAERDAALARGALVHTALAALSAIGALAWAVASGPSWSTPSDVVVVGSAWIGAACLVGALPPRRSTTLVLSGDVPAVQWVLLAVTTLTELGAGALALVAAEKAVNGDASIGAVVLVHLVVVLMSSLSAGGAGVAGLTIVLGLTAVGVPMAAAAVAAVAARGVMHWLPVAGGRPMVRRLSRRLVL